MNFIGSVWDIFWFFFWVFVWVAYLFVLIYIVIDIFRDHSLNGWGKALWIVFLIFVPFLAILVYLIARGRGMAQRSNREVAEVRASQDEYIRNVAGASPSSSDEIAKGKALLDAGTISQGEFETIKARALAT